MIERQPECGTRLRFGARFWMAPLGGYYLKHPVLRSVPAFSLFRIRLWVVRRVLLAGNSALDAFV